MPSNIILERLENLAEHIAVVEDRMQLISSAEDFKTKEGSLVYDAILMRLQSIGENVKQLESLQPGFSKNRLGITGVNPVIRFIDLISHHYEKLDSEVIYDIVMVNIEPLKEAVKETLEQEKKLKQEQKIKKVQKPKLRRGRGR